MKMNRTLRAVCLAVMMCSAVPSGAKEVSWVENLAQQDAKFEAKVGPLAAKIEIKNPKLMADLKKYNLGARDVAKTLGQQATDLVFVPNAPCRAVETRDIGGPFTANQIRAYDMAGSGVTIDFSDQVTGANGATPCAVTALPPITGSVPKAVLVAISVIGPSNAGFLNAWAFNDTEPVVATMLFNGGGLASTFAVVPFCQSTTSYCADDINVKLAGATGHIAMDIYGYFAVPEATPLQCLEPSAAGTAGTWNTGTGVEVNFPACAVGYTRTGVSCGFSGSAPAGVLLQEGSASFGYCRWLNNTGVSQAGLRPSLFATTSCCRVPGR